MRKAILLTITFLVFLITSARSQDTGIASYYPTRVGNLWVYQYGLGGMYPPCTSYVKVQIVDSVEHFGNIYYLFMTTQRIVYGNMTCYDTNSETNRINSATGNILRYVQNTNCYLPHEIVVDSLRSRLNDTLNSCESGGQFCFDTGYSIIFGENRQNKKFISPSQEGGKNWTYTKGLGYTQEFYSCNSYHYTLSITGCVINGVVYGDTTFIIGIKQISSEVPKTFTLSQNYPNPFNPTTKIQFQLPASPIPSQGGVNVKLVVYDILGREVSWLIPPLGGGQEGLSPGTYEVEWDGSNYPSGVYFYKLIVDGASAPDGIGTGPFSITKKMVLLK